MERSFMSEGYSAAELITIIAALGVFVTGVGAVIVNIVVALRSSHKLTTVIEKTDNLSGKVDVQSGKIEQVHTLTNSNLSSVKAELSSAVKEIVSMKEVITDLKAERDKAATIQTVKEPVKPEEAAASGVATGIAREQLEVQKQIEENTAPEKS